MSEKMFNTRIIHKHDIEANWLKAENFVPLIGEIIVYDVDENYDYERIKIGDGVSNINALPFALSSELDALQTQLNNKQDKLTFDSAPTENSSNPVTSGGLFTKCTEQDGNIETALMTANLAMPGSLKWDGYVGDRECVIVYEEPMGEGVTARMQLVHVSDYIPEILTLMMGEAPAEERILPVLMSMSGMEGGGMHQITPMEVQVADDMLIMGDGFAFIPTDGYSLEGITFPKRGWYFISQSYIMGDIEIPLMYCSGLQTEMLNFPDTNGGGSDKYFEDVTETTVLGDTLTWDGNTDGLVATNIFKPTDTASITFYKLSDSVPTLADFSNGCTITVNRSGVSQSDSLSYDEIRNAWSDDGFCELEVLVVVPTNGFDYLNIITFPEAGVYAILQTGLDEVTYCSSLTIPGYNFTTTTTQKIIKTEHLPEALRFGEITTETRSDTLTWDGNTEGLTQMFIFIKISDSVPTMTDFNGGNVIVLSDGSSYSNVEFETEYDGIYGDSNGYVTIVTETGIGIDVSGGSVSGGLSFTETGTYFTKNPSTGVHTTSFTINGYNGFVTKTTELVKIDPKYLPDGIGGGSGGSGLPEVSADDNGKSVSVVDGEWVVKKQSYNDLSDKPNYAGSSSAGGSANSAVKLDSSAGSATQPVYFSGGKPIATSYTLGKSVPSDAKFTDTVYTHPTYTAKNSGLYKVAIDSTGHVSGTAAVTKSDITALGIPAKDTTYSEATTTTAGLMSAADKVKLDGLGEPGSSAEGAVLYTEQELTDTQKKQACVNIGAVGEDGLFEYQPVGGDTVTWNGYFDGLEEYEEAWILEDGTVEYSGDVYYKVGDISQSAIDQLREAYETGNLTLSATLYDYSTGEICPDYEVWPINNETSGFEFGLSGGYINTYCYDFCVVRIYIVGEAAVGTSPDMFPSSGIWYHENMEYPDQGVYAGEVCFNGIGLAEKKVIKSDLLGSVNITTDTEMSDTSTNPVQNKVIKAYVDAAIGAAIAASY